MQIIARLRCTIVLAAVLALLGAEALPAAAQATGTIRGRVVEAGSQRPLNSVQVSVVDVGRGALTNAAGEFLLVGVPAGSHRIRAQLIGYTTAEQTVVVSAEQVARADFSLSQSAIALDEIVVTGTAGATQRRALGNAVTRVDAAEVMAKTTIANMTELLQARSPGVQILPNSGVPGAAADIRIRGASSLLHRPPVVFVDGVRYNTDDLGSFTPSGAGATSFSGQRTSAFDLINPNDIESIEIIKGPAAATLYGAEAANGVIQIITKRGARGEQQVQWTARVEQGFNEWALPIPDNYTTCTAARIAEVSGGQPVWPGCQGVPEGTILRGNPLREDPLALRRGDVQRAALSLRGGGERYSFYVGGDYDLNEGIFYNSSNQRQSLRANFSLVPNNWMDLALSTSYVRGNLRLPVGDEAAQGMLLSAFRGRPGRVTVNPLNAGWAINRAEQANQYNNSTRSDRLTLGTTVNLTPLPWFRNRLTVGLDYTASLAQILSPAGSVDADFAGVPEGFIAQRVPRNYVYSIDYAGNVELPLTASLQSTTSFGMQAVARRFESLFASGTGFGAPDVNLIGAAQSQFGSNAFSENKSLGLFVQEQIAWNNRIYLTGALRADDNSSFGESFDWIVYPKASLSWVISEEPVLQGLFEAARVESFRFRTAYGQAGSAPDPFAADQSYTVDKAVTAAGTVVSALRARSLGNPDLVAERGAELEIGFDAGILNDRIGIDFTYYDKRMRDVIISTGAPGSTGFGGTFYNSTGLLPVLKNLGETHNSGIELGINAVPIQTRQLTWDSRISLSTNRNRLVTFGDARTREPISGQSYGSVQEHRVGHPLGGYWVPVPRRNPDGSLMLNPNGTVQLDTSSFIGPSIPTREIAFANNVTFFRDFRLYALLDYKGGHYLYNYKEFARCTVATQLNCERMNNPALADHPDRPLWLIPYGYIERADFVKLRDLSLTYAFPFELARRFGTDAASVTLAGHNLAQWTDYSGIDPEVSGYGNRTGSGAFARSDVYPVPMTRRLSLSLNVSF